MKIFFIAVIFGISFSACEGKKSNENNSETNSPEIEKPVVNEGMKSEIPEISPEFKKGEELVNTNDCLGCHKINEKLVGPSYKEIATKYALKDLEFLSKKIISGGKGNWGEVPMTPHPNVSDNDATEMVKYILSLK